MGDVIQIRRPLSEFLDDFKKKVNSYEGQGKRIRQVIVVCSAGDTVYAAVNTDEHLASTLGTLNLAEDLIKENFGPAFIDDEEVE